MKTRQDGGGGDRFEPALSADEVDELWETLESAERRQDGHRTIRKALAVSVLAAAVSAVVVGAWQLRSPGPLRAMGSGPALVDSGRPIPSSAYPVLFQDGSRLEADGATRLTILDNDDRRFTTQLAQGRVRFTVTPGGPRRWVVETDLATVEVIGTVFEADRNADGLSVRVERGVVLVRGERVPERLRRLTAGESLSIADAPAVASTASDRSEEVAASPPPARPPPGRTTPLASAGPQERPSAEGPSDDSLDALLDGLEADRRAGRRAESRARLQERLRGLEPSAETVTLLMTLAQWTSDDGDDVASARLLERVDPAGLPPELVEAAWRSAAASWRRAGRVEDALRVENRLRTTSPARPFAPPPAPAP